MLMKDAIIQRASVFSRTEVSRKSLSRRSSSIYSSKRSSKRYMTLDEKLKMAEFLSDAELIEKKQWVKVN